ncbi:hypothetical protein ACFX1R_021049 [Malus domestica]
MSDHCHIALTPKPWMRRRLGLEGFEDCGTQQCMVVAPSLRSVIADRRPARAKVNRWHEFLDWVMLKHGILG